ncbi:TcpE family conjugal transfer membrane protein [Streptococcus sp. H31]|uniref:TcpE family conjugal transfer membrane protein n=1 Tax=Streptococcus huangxiaojuni TaxID=3237239 RepID=UPI0034A39CD3
MKKKDKELYSYKQALSQPYWVQRLTNTFSLSSAFRLSFFAYGIAVGGLLWLLLLLLLPFTPWGARTVFSGIVGWYAGHFLSELLIDGKGVIFFLKDYLLFYVRYGFREDSIYINKGQVYRKPKGKELK